MTYQASPADLVISHNDCGFVCELCGRQVVPHIGPELFVDGRGLCCWDCGRQLRPELVAELERHYGGAP